MSVDNPIYFIFDMMKSFVNFLGTFKVYGITYYVWILSFIVIGMFVSVFWRGAKG